MKHKLFLISLCCFIQLEFSSQLNNNLLVKATDSTSFFIYINGFIQHSSPYNNIKITKYTESSMTLKIVIADSTNQEINKQIYFEDTHKETSADLIYVNNQYKFRFNGEVNIGVQPIDTTQLVVEYHNSKIFIDSVYQLISDTLFNIESLLNNEIYYGETGCLNPIKDNSTIINTINKEIFSDKKLEIAITLINENCLSVSDIIDIIALFEFDDQKLEIAINSSFNSYDKENYKQIKNFLLLKSSKDSFQKFLDEKK